MIKKKLGWYVYVDFVIVIVKFVLLFLDYYDIGKDMLESIEIFFKRFKCIWFWRI